MGWRYWSVPFTFLAVLVYGMLGGPLPDDGIECDEL